MSDVLNLLREAIQGEADGATIPVPVEDIRALLTEIQQRELHHFETEALLAQAGLDPDAQPEWEYGFRAPGVTWPAVSREEAERYVRADPLVFDLVRRTAAGPWTQVHTDGA